MNAIEAMTALLEGKKVLDPDGCILIKERGFPAAHFVDEKGQGGEVCYLYPDDILSENWTVVDE